MEQYFSKQPNSADNEKQFIYSFEGHEFEFKTNNGVFSKKAVDFGTNLMLEAFCFENKNVHFKNKTILDIGCGIGVVGVVLGRFFKASSIVMLDINERAVELSKKNAILNNVDNCNVLQSNLFESIHDKSFDYMLTNPPIRAGKSLVFELYTQAFEHLNIGGSLYIVIQKKQGAKSSQKKLEELFGNSTIIEKKQVL